MTEAETGVKYTENQWDVIRHIREQLEEPERAASNSPAAVAAARDQDPELTNTLMCLCILVV